MEFHKSVLLEESVTGLITNKDGIYVDVTYGGGGHSRKILEKISLKAKLFSFDKDNDALKNKLKDPRLILIHSNFKEIKRYLKFYGISSVDGILADFGVSSYQFDTKERGFSIRNEGPLDMRMDQNSSLSAHEVVNKYSENRLKDIFKKYGDIKDPSKITLKILTARSLRPLNTTDDLLKLIKPLIPQRYLNKYAAQIFQAIRIEVNQELEAIKELLTQSIDLLNSKGRLVCLTYHSLEDRLVKKFIKEGVFEGYAEKDFYGNINLNFKKFGNFLRPSTGEVLNNNRSRSAKLRIAEKI
mgnify:FL=1|tara:strand:- start:364 stop:1260 length:897 start_codon:yes stop_codon:yes gene_type:complete